MEQDNLDVYVYSGSINRIGYLGLCEAIKKKASDSALLIIATPGGDAHQGFRIARALQHHYGKFEALVPRYCKSAGTLVLLGASKLYLDNMSELGPLDVQVKKGDEIAGRNSGLDILQAVNYLQSQAMNAFREYVVDLTQFGLSTRIAADISCKLTTGLFEPISAQVDPMKLAEMQRATEIAFAYGKRLAESGKNLLEEGITRLVTDYPSHGFVIDRKEARTIFRDVDAPDAHLIELSKKFHDDLWFNVDSSAPIVKIVTIPRSTRPNTQEPSDEASPDTLGGEVGLETGQQPSDGAGEGEPSTDGTEIGRESTDADAQPAELPA